jgi:hypothetical protein
MLIETMKNAGSYCMDKGRTLGKMVVAGGAMVAGSAHAALSTEIGTGLTAIQTDALALVDLVWPVVVAITGAFIIFKLFKRGVSKV